MRITHFAPTLAMASTLLLSACSDGGTGHAPGAMTTEETHALKDAADMIAEGRPTASPISASADQAGPEQTRTTAQSSDDKVPSDTTP